MTIKSFECKNCGASITIRAIGRSISAVCESCHSVADLTDENYKIIAQANAQIPIQPSIDLGSRGFLKGIEWEIIGFMQRQNVEYNYYWQEYLLFNPRYGYRWLTEAEGHWNFVTMLKAKPQINHQLVGLRSIAEHKYYLYSRGIGQVSFVLGEFYWRIQIHDKALLSDYIDPPYVLSCEKVENEENWSLGEYIEPNEIEKAFSLKHKSLTRKIGISPNQPSIYLELGKSLKKLLIGFIGLAFVLQLLQVFMASNQIVYQNVFSKNTSQITTPPIDLKGNLANAELIVLAPSLNNNWLAIEGELVNDKTGQVYPFEKSIEYYSGYDQEDGAWTEGSKKGANLLSNVPSGIYHLNAKFETSASSLQNFELILRRSVPTWGNFWFALFLLFIPYIIYFMFEYNFEKQRWAESDFSPYEAE